jgi:large repetitive protein
MRRKSASTSGLTFLFCLVLTHITSAGTLVINYTHRGWYDVTGFHDPTGVNYYVGDDSGLPGLFDDYRNFFVFDMSTVTQPIESAKLALFVPRFGGDGGYGYGGYESPDPSENYELHDVVTPIAALMAGTGGVAAWDDLGSGVVYGSRTMTAADNGNVIEITLNSSAIAAMNSTHGLFGIGGSITTLDKLPNFEGTFGASARNNFVSELRLAYVPEPSTLLLLGIGAISLLGYRKAKSHS